MRGLIKNIFKNALLLLITFSITIFTLTSLYTLTALIPKKSIYSNTLESANILNERYMFDELSKNMETTKIDRYADTFIISIAYFLDNDKPLESAMYSGYYSDETKNVNVNLLNALENDYEPNEQYLRYWHGTAIIIRPLLLIFNLNQIYIVLSVALIILNLVLVYMLKKRGYISLIVVYLAALLIVNVITTFFCLEYICMFIIMTLTTIIAVRYKDKSSTFLNILFFLSAVITVFFDFLTTETMSLTVPLLILVIMYRNDKKDVSLVQLIKYSAGKCIAWCSGYVMMWLTKWIMASAILNINAMDYVKNEAMKRINGDVNNGIIGRIEVLIRNIKCLFPLSLDSDVWFPILIIMIIVISYILYVYKRKHVDKAFLYFLLIFGLIPYVRYELLYSHSYAHYFFTYRSQISTVMCIMFGIMTMCSFKKQTATIKKKKSIVTKRKRI